MLRLFRLSFRELLRNRFGLVLLLLIPPVFLGVVDQTSGTDQMPIDLFFYQETKNIWLSQYDINLVFIASAVCGFLTAYYAILLFHRNFDYFRYCVGAGLSSNGFIAARFLFFLTVTLILSVLTGTLLSLFVDIEQVVQLLLGFMLMGTIYGAFGGIAGLLSKDLMVAILCIVLLANLDAGWLQNPVFYSSAQQTELIQWLPAFYPAQTIFAAAFTEEWNIKALIFSSLYAFILISLMTAIVHFKLRNVKKRSVS